MVSSHRAVVVVPGRALQIDVRHLTHFIKTRPAIREHLLRYVQTLFTMTAQLALCNARHVLDQRLVRWMLMAQDRLDGDTLPVTHDEIAMMLGVRRAGISELLADFEANGLVKKVRGALKIVSRAGLEKRGCECAGIIGQVYNRAFPPCGSGVQTADGIRM